MIALLLAGAVWAAEPATCDDRFDPPPDMVAVAWVSRGRQRVGNGGWVEVVRTTDLVEWVGRDKTTVGRMLQRLGLQKKAKEPRQPYKVTIFEVAAADLCRPIEGAEGTTVAGVAVCEPAQSRATAGVSGCGYTTDRATGKRGLDTWRIQWRDAAARGFCVLPAQRYVDEAAQPVP